MLVLSFWQSFYVFQINFSSSLLSNDIAPPPICRNVSSFSLALDIFTWCWCCYCCLWCEMLKFIHIFFHFPKKRGRKKAITLFTMNTHCKLFDFQHEQWVKLCIYFYTYFFYFFAHIFYTLTSQCIFLLFSSRFCFFLASVRTHSSLFKCCIHFWLLCCHSSAPCR